jgi:hypothetical protein
MSRFSEEHVYDALALPNEAIASGGIEILRAGIIDDELYVTARRAFADPAQWGEVIADIARRLAALYAAEGEFDESEAIAAIAAAFAADLGAPAVDVPSPRRKPKAKTKARTKTKSKAKTKSPARGKPARAAKPARAQRAKTPSRPAKKAGKRSKR